MILLLGFIELGCCKSFWSVETTSAELKIKQPFQPIRIEAGTSFEFSPSNNLEILYTSTEGGCSDNSTDNPEYSLMILNDSLAKYSEIWTGGNRGQGEQKYLIETLTAGQTAIQLEASWYVEGATDAIRKSQSFEVALIVF